MALISRATANLIRVGLISALRIRAIDSVGASKHADISIAFVSLTAAWTRSSAAGRRWRHRFPRANVGSGELWCARDKLRSYSPGGNRRLKTKELAYFSYLQASHLTSPSAIVATSLCFSLGDVAPAWHWSPVRPPIRVDQE